VSFPNELADFFFEYKEQVTVVDAHDEATAKEKLNEIIKPNDFRRAVLTVSDGS
jgi:hypothetical protein